MKIKIGREGQEIGEYPEEAIPALIQSNVVRPTDLFWHEGMSDWAPISSRWVTVAPPLPSASTPGKRRSRGGARTVKILSALAMVGGVLVMSFGVAEHKDAVGMTGAYMLFAGFFGFVVGRFME